MIEQLTSGLDVDLAGVLPAIRYSAKGTSMRLFRNTSGKAAFFCWHSVAEPGWPFLSVSPADFERHLATLRRRGWTSGDERTLEQIAAGVPLERRTAFLTFDDGYLDNHTHALPLLRRYGMTAFVFVLPPLLDDGGALCWSGLEEAHANLPGVMRSMTWEMAEEMAEAGHVIGSHTVSHPHLTGVSDEQLRDELVDSRRRIQERLGRCDSLAYPYGDEDERVRAAARDAGYRWAFTLPRGGQRTVEPLAIPRVAVDHRDRGHLFGAKLLPLTRRAMLSQNRAYATVAGAARRVAQRFR